MAPANPKAFTGGSNPVSKFENAFIVTKHSAPPGRSIYFHVRIDTQHPRLLALERAGIKPPMHFHGYQTEFVEVKSGSLAVDIEGVPHEFVNGDGEYAVKPGRNHRLYGTPGQAAKTVEFYLSASSSGTTKELDQAFFENWYGYQEEIMLRNESVDLIQLLCMFDAGDSYLTFPWWVPFGQTLSWLLGVIVGRYVGGLLGYQPFFPEWTTDWDAACRKMESCWAQRRFAVRGQQMERREEYLRAGKDVGNGALFRLPDGVPLEREWKKMQ